MIKKFKVNIILPRNTKQEIRERMLKEKYGLREKSKWISEAIEYFLKLKDFPDLVKTAQRMSNLKDVETIYITQELDDKMNEAILEVKKKFINIEGVKSLIVRASIVRRLLELSPIKK